MRNLLALIGLVVVGFFGLGWYLGWYTFALEAGSNGKKRIQLDVDTQKIVNDAQKVIDKTTTPSTRSAADDFVGPLPKELTPTGIKIDIPPPPAIKGIR